jgi:hypothetical protein
MTGPATAARPEGGRSSANPVERAGHAPQEADVDGFVSRHSPGSVIVSGPSFLSGIAADGRPRLVFYWTGYASVIPSRLKTSRAPQKKLVLSEPPMCRPTTCPDVSSTAEPLSPSSE